MMSYQLLQYLLAVFLLPYAPGSGESTLGKDFYIAFPKSRIRNELLSVHITTEHNQNIPVLVESTRHYNALIYVRSGVTTVLNPPRQFEILSKLDHDKGIRIHPINSAQKISVSVLKKALSNPLSGTYLALPPIMYPNLREYVYFVSSYFWNNRVQATNYSSTVVLVGSQANTSVTITPSQRIEIPPYFLRSSYPQATVNAGESYTVTLQKMETLSMESFRDLTGTRIVSNKPITVLGSHECADVPVDVGFCDFLVEQFPPTITWGRFFLLTSLHSRLTGEYYKIIGMKSLTSIRVKCVIEGQSSPELGHVTILLNTSGETREFALGRDRYCSVIANKPILLIQYSLGYSLDNVGDPFMLVIPPVEQYNNNYSIKTREDFNNHLTITVPLEHYSNSSILLNNTRLVQWFPIYCFDSVICGYGTRLSVPAGTHRVHHVDNAAKIMVFVYGFEYHDGYGQIAGMKLEKIADLCQHGELRLSPLNSYSGGPGVTGSVEICVDGVWTSLCGNEWSAIEAAVACRELGYMHYGSITHSMNSSRTRWPTIANDIRCLQSESRLTECIHSWEVVECSTAQPVAIRCYPYYGITVEIPTHSPVEFHHTYHTVTLTCRTALNRTLENGLSLRTGWAKDSAFLLNSTRYRVSESVSAVSDNSGRPVTHYESNLTIHVLKPIDNGTYICSSAVVSDSSGQLLTEAFSSSVDIDVVESDNQLFQMRLLGVGRCSDWLLQHESPLVKGDQVKDTIMEDMKRRCQCDVSTILVSDGVFRCFRQNSHEITFRARIHASEVGVRDLIRYLTEWVSGGPVVSIGGVLLRADPECEVVIDSFSSDECGRSLEPVTMASDIINSASTTVQDKAPTTTGAHSPGSVASVSTTLRASDTTTSAHGPVARDACDSSSQNHLGITFAIIGSVVFVITVLVITIACVAVIVSCLKFYRKTASSSVLSATSPMTLTLPLYDDPVSENLNKSDLSTMTDLNTL